MYNAHNYAISIERLLKLPAQTANETLTDGNALKIGLGFGNIFPILIILGLLLLKNAQKSVDKGST